MIHVTMISGLVTSDNASTLKLREIGKGQWAYKRLYMTESKSAPEGVVLRLLIPSRFQFKVALVMTDGKQTVDEGVLSADILYNAVQPLKDKNVKVLSLGIGKNTNLFDLLTLASSGSDVFLAENFEQLKDLVTDLTQNKCPGKRTCKKRKRVSIGL